VCGLWVGVIGLGGWAATLFRSVFLADRKVFLADRKFFDSGERLFWSPVNLLLGDRDWNRLLVL
jgi:hypothetical protein